MTTTTISYLVASYCSGCSLLLKHSGQVVLWRGSISALTLCESSCSWELLRASVLFFTAVLLSAELQNRASSVQRNYLFGVCVLLMCLVNSLLCLGAPNAFG
jgi:hypothetical protein